MDSKLDVCAACFSIIPQGWPCMHGAHHFDEVNDDVQITDDAKLTLPDADWTMGIWFKLTDNSGAAFQYVISWAAYGDDPSFNAVIREAGAATPNVIETKINSLALSRGGTPGTSTAWQFVLWQRSGGTVTVYLDDSAIGVTIALGAPVNVAGNLFLGANSDLDADRFFGGDLAEFFKIDRALTALERTSLANGASPARLNGPNMVYYPMVAGHYAEYRAGGLTVSNTGSTDADHAPVAPPFGFDLGWQGAAGAAPPDVPQGRTKGVTKRRMVTALAAAQRDDPDGNPTEEYLLLRTDQYGRTRVSP